MTVTFCLSYSLGLLNWRPRAHSAGCRLSLLHLISIFSGPQTPSGFPRAPSVGCGFPYHISSLQLSETLLETPLARRTQLNYIIVRRPLDLWNRMFNRHQAEITVMQFTGHSLPVHQSMSVPWEFFSSSHFISQFPPTRFPHITAIGMYHFFPVHHLEWHFTRAEGRNITFSQSFIASDRSSGLHPVSSLSCCMHVRAGRPAFARPYVGAQRSTSFMSSSLLLQ